MRIGPWICPDAEVGDIDKGSFGALMGRKAAAGGEVQTVESARLDPSGELITESSDLEQRRAGRDSSSRRFLSLPPRPPPGSCCFPWKTDPTSHTPPVP